ncbi:MAG TPA: HNH endonuclease, partial [Candidatus Corynebacterium gallistercoris]|nr:HNH endonuclease [Candidatus Corynebacterium gallistercoris]
MALKYKAGIDVGTHSLGCAAIEVDEAGQPVRLLSAVSFIHDSGIDPDSNKSAETRLAASGVARRTRRLYRRRKRRTIKLEKFLRSQGWKTVPFEEYRDPYFPWKARVSLVNEYITNDSERGELLSVALRHIANHRGWRNPYHKTSSLYSPDGPSDAFEAIRKELSEKTRKKIPDDVTVGQLISFAQFGQDRLRGGGKEKDKKKDPAEVKQAVISSRLQQVDHAREINEICRVQKVDDQLRKRIIDLVFEAESPKGAQAKRIGKDPLQPGKNRALKASDAFQRYRISALIGNLWIRSEGNEKLPLSSEQRTLVFDHLVNLPSNKEPSWLEVANILGIDRGQLRGTATLTDDGERAGARPPVHDTNRVIRGSKVKQLAAWWEGVDDMHRAAMLKALSNSEKAEFDTREGAAVQAFFAELEEEDHAKLDSLHLPMGRAAYSEDTLRRLTDRMQQDNVNLYEARRAEFGVAEDWVPPKPRIGEPVGNPAVDRVLKSIARWLESAEAEWGAPESVVIEHVRDGFISESSAREISRENDKRHKRNLKLYEEMKEKLNIEGKVRRADLWRYQSVQRQNCQCAYCGTEISFFNSEMDHIVPRAGQGSTNIRENLLAVCHRCNISKKNIPFATWAERSSIPGVSLAEALERTRFWNNDPGQSTRDARQFRSAVCERLKRTELDEPIDSRSLESVAWMANEVRSRVAQHFKESG